jgi:hypothetical protein
MLNEQKITYRMRTLMESGFFGGKVLLTEAFADRDKVRLFQAAYNYTYNKNLAVDGEKGAQTNAAIADVKKQLVKDKLDNEGAKDFYANFLTKLVDDKEKINVGQGGVNTNKILNRAIQALINLAGTPLGIDGVIGTKTIAAIKTVIDENDDSGAINSENISQITGKAAKNVLDLGVEGIATVQGAATQKSPAQIVAKNPATNKDSIAVDIVIQNFNKDMKILFGKIKDNPNKQGTYGLYRGESINFFNDKNVGLGKSTNMISYFKDIIKTTKDVNARGKWSYNAVDNSFSFDGGKYIHKIT